jgi:hypothetical protein
VGICEELIAHIPLVNQFFLYEEFLSAFFDGVDASFCMFFAPWGSKILFPVAVEI